jgi:hypothetical protein
MRLAAALFAVFASAAPAHADPASAVVHVGLSDGGQYDVTVARDGIPTSLQVHEDRESFEMSVRLVDGGRLRYEIKRSGIHSFKLDGEIVPHDKPMLIGHIPYQRGACDVRLRMTDD